MAPSKSSMRERPPVLQGSIEILRRGLCLGLLLVGAWYFLVPAEHLLRVSLPDLRAGYERETPRVGTDSSDFGDWLERKLEGRTLEVSGAAWVEMARILGAQRTAGESLPDNMPARLHEHLDADGREFWFAADDPLTRSLAIPTREYRYLLPLEAPEAPPLGANFEETRYARSAPDHLRYPGRTVAPWLLLAAIAVYFLPPRPIRHDGAAHYGAASAILLPDLLGQGLTLFFYCMPLMIISSNVGPSEIFSFDRGWAILTLVFWGLALLAGVIPATAARYACFEARILEEGLTIRTLWAIQYIPFREVAKAEAYDGSKRARLLSRLLLIFGGGMPQTVGMAFLVARNVEWGLELKLVDGQQIRLMFNSLRNAERLLDALATAGITVPGSLRRAVADN